jgi:hypothetical protein
MLPTAEFSSDLWVLPLWAILIVAIAFLGAAVRDWAKRRASSATATERQETGDSREKQPL